MKLGTYIVVNSISCLDNYLQECTPATHEGICSNPGRDMSVWNALVEDGANSGKVFSKTFVSALGKTFSAFNNALKNKRLFYPKRYLWALGRPICAPK
jgi:uncharacterized protein YgfB (UPF0149 family)